MAKVSAEGVGKFYHHYPRVAVIVTAQAEGRADAMAVAWHTAISVNPPLYGIAITTKRFTYQLIIESGEFGVNFMPFNSAELVAAVGGSKGAEIDKFQNFDIARDKPLKTAVPILKDAYAAYECKLFDHRSYGDHELMIGEIVAVHSSAAAFTSDEVLDLDKILPVLYLGGELYSSSTKETMRLLDRQVYGGKRH